MSATYQANIGSRNWCDLGLVNHGSNFKGVIENIQIFNRAWSTADMSTDSATPLGLINNTNLVVRYMMTHDYQEGRVTSAVSESTPYGVNISFGDGDLSSDSYVQSDNYVTI